MTLPLLALLGASSPDGPSLRLEVPALMTLSELDLSNAQLHSLQSIATDTAAKMPTDLTPPDGDKAKALAELHKALLSDDESKVVDAREKYDDAMGDEQDDVQIAITSAAREKAASVVQLLTAVQLSGYIAEHSEEVPGATATMMDGLALLDEEPDSADDIRTQVISQAAMLIAGLDPAQQAPVATQIGTWFDAAAKMSARDRAAKHATLESDARKIVGNLDPFDALRHWMCRDMAELLSNPELPAALAERLK